MCWFVRATYVLDYLKNNAIVLREPNVFWHLKAVLHCKPRTGKGLVWGRKSGLASSVGLWPGLCHCKHVTFTPS